MLLMVLTQFGQRAAQGELHAAQRKPGVGGQFGMAQVFKNARLSRWRCRGFRD
jgi:hypothetical protein